ncbi:GNAT family N-acetyltransferase [Roseateles albus]|uniref:GNAT family N-acetyltransferase n=1 Tax=Roseateles albus TaxID=2987525 RepID=A0ABT5KEX8_9BURK|nr:GNAT family N-acetyltransferase [Roseateles albus]MDC8772099.1 GNAT family N-acetyltransferase [Roseateles albus]
MRTRSTALCTLEPQVAAHAMEMFSVLSDAAIYEFENVPPPSVEWLAERYKRLERRASEDGQEAWLNWVLRLPSGELAGYVQATVLPSGSALIAYELNSRFWRRGIGRCAVTAVMDELALNYGVSLFAAVLKSANFRSRALLASLGFEPASPEQVIEFEAEPDELLMVNSCKNQRRFD